jgi:predicted nucleic acid-binding protein
VRISGILDTTIVIDILRADPVALYWYEGLGQQRVAITPIVWMEIVQGARDKTDRAQLLRFLRQFPVEHPTADDNHWAMRQFAQFHLSHGVEMADVMIASVAVRDSVPLYTLNLRHYQPLVGVDAQRPYR